MSKPKPAAEKAPFPKTLIEAVRYFEDFHNCLDFLVDMRWPGGVECPRCDSREVTYLAKARVWKCRGKHESQKFSAKTGTVMEDSPLPLQKWLPAIWLLVNCKNGISSYELHRALGVTQKTAWFMLQRIRLAMQDGADGGKLGGDVEVDETFIGGLARNMHKSQRAKKIKGTGGKGKAAVLGLLERHGKIHVKHIDNLLLDTLQGHVRKHVEPGSTVHTDQYVSYQGLDKDFEHKVINHAVSYVEGTVHTNSIENFWALLKRTIKGTYVSVEPFHLFRYLDEQAFRFNERKGTDRGRFIEAVRAIVGKRLTYKQLIGQTELAGANP